MMFDSHSHFFSPNCVSVINKSDCDFTLNEESVFSIGMHPWTASYNNEKFEEIMLQAKNKNCLAIGEIGLDKITGPEMNLQLDVFRKQIEIAEKLELPVIFHCVKSWNELLEVYRKIQPKQTWIFHGFNKVGILNELLQTNFMISIGVAILSNVKLQKSLEMIPNDRLLIETDNSKMNILEVYKKVSEIKKISLLELENLIEDNFKRTFKKWQIG